EDRSSGSVLDADVGPVVVRLGDDACPVRLDLDARAATEALSARRVIPAAVLRVFAARHLPIVARTVSERRQVVVAARSLRARCDAMASGETFVLRRDALTGLG